MTIPLYPDAIAYVATEQMLEVDRAMMEDYRIELIQMMESAGRNLAHIARVRFLDGYHLKGAPRGTAADLIRWANAQLAPILALDVPSGVDTTTRTVFDPAIKATAIMTLALPKAGLRAPGVETQIGELYLADISVPPSL